jgi:hypothetical protein
VRKSAPPRLEASSAPFAYPFLKVKPVIFMEVAKIFQILLFFSASKIASPSPYFMKFKLLSILKPTLSVPLYSPEAS